MELLPQYNLVIKNGEYLDKEGDTKFRWLIIGRIYLDKSKPFILIDKTFNPAGVQNKPREENSGRCYISLFPPDEPSAEPLKTSVRQPFRGRKSPAVDPSMDDDIPF